MKVKFIRCYYKNLESNNNIDTPEKQKESKDNIKNLPDNVKKFLGLEKGNYKILKNKKGEKIYKFEDFKIKEKDLLELGKFIKKKMENKDNLLHKVKDFSITDIVNYLDDKNLNIKDIKDNIQTTIGEALTTIVNIQDTKTYKLISKDPDLLSYFMDSISQSLNYNMLYSSDITDLIKQYENKLFSHIKNSNDVEYIIRNYMLEDIIDNPDNIKLYKNLNYQGMMNFLGINLKENKKRVYGAYFNFNNSIGTYLKSLDYNTLGNLNSTSNNNLLSNFNTLLNNNLLSFNKKFKKKNKEKIGKEKSNIETNDSVIRKLFIKGIFNTNDISKISENEVNMKVEKVIYNEGKLSLGLENISFSKITKKGETLSINDLLILNYLFGGQESFIKEKQYYKDNISKLLNKFGVKDILSLKETMYKENINKNGQLDFLFKDKENLNIPYGILKDISLNLDKPEKLKSILSHILDYVSNERLEKITQTINSMLKEKNLKPIDKKNIDEIYKQGIKELYLSLKGLKNIKFDKNFIKIFEKESKLNVTNENNFLNKIKDFFNPENIKNLEIELSNCNEDSITFFTGKLNKTDIFKNLRKGGRKISPEDKATVALTFQKIFKDALKGTMIDKVQNFIDSNKALQSDIEKAVKNNLGVLPQEKRKMKELSLLLLKEKMGYILLNEKKNKLTKKDLIKNKDTLLDEIQKKLKIPKNSDFYKRIENTILDLANNIPPEGYVFDKKALNNLKKDVNQTKELINRVSYDIELFEKLGYEGYVRYYEELESKKELLTKGGSMIDTLPLSDLPFNFEGDESQAQTHFEEVGGIKIIYLKIPGENEVTRITSLDMGDANKDAISIFLEKSFGFPIAVKGEEDDINRLVSDETDISKEVIGPKDFQHIVLKAQNVIYNNFYKNGGENEKRFLKENHLEDPKLMYEEPQEFGRKFAEGIKKITNVGGIKLDFGRYYVDLSTIDKNLLDHSLAQKTKDKVLKGEYEEKEKTVWGKVSSFFNKRFNFS